MERLARLALRRPAATLAVLAALTAALGGGVLRLDTDAGFRAYVGAEHPAVQRLDAFVSQFGGGLPAAAVWSCDDTSACASALDAASLEMASQVALRLGQVDGVLAVESPATSALLVPTREGFAVRRLMEAGAPVPDRADLAERALQDPLWVGTLVSADASVGAIWIELASSGSSDNLRVMSEMEEALAPWRSGGFEFHLIGAPVEFVVAGRDLQRDTFRLVPAIVLLVGAVTWLLFRSVPIVLASLVTVGIAVVWAFGAMGWLGWPQTAVTQALAPFILVVGVCDATHLVSRYAAECARASDGSSATRTRCLVRAVADVGPACLLASLTTAAGFFSFATSGAVSFARFGTAAALGVLGALVLTFSLLVIVLERLPLASDGQRRRSDGWDVALERTVRSAQRRSGLILTASALIGLLCAGGITQLRADVRAEHLFGERSDVVRWIRFVESHLRHSETLEVELRIPASRDLREPQVLRTLGEATRALEAAPWSGRARSIDDVLARLRALVRGETPAVLEEEREARSNAELLLLAELEDPWTVRRWVSEDERALRISVDVLQGSTRRDASILADVARRLAPVLAPGWESSVTGPLTAAFHMVDEVQRTQLRSFTTATVVVFALLVVGLRSVGWAALAMLPNLLPVVACLGAMGLWGIDLDMGTAMVGAVVLGIAVDDTIHVLHQYRRRIDAGSDPSTAIRGAAVHVGRALVTTSFALSSGFFLLTLSSWQSVASFGFLCGISILCALVADIALLPALVCRIAGNARPTRRPATS